MRKLAASPYRLLLLLALIFGALEVYVYFIDVPARQEAREIQTREEQLLHLGYRQIDKLTWTTPREHFAMIKDEHDRWWITEPVQAQADSREVRKILRALVLGKISRVIDEQGTAADKFGLAPPHLIITATAGDRTERLELGDPGPLSSTLYVRKGTEGPIVLTSLNVRTFAQKSLDHFRRKDILSFDHQHITRIDLEQRGELITLVRATGIHGITHHWRIVHPIKASGDATRILGLLMHLNDLTAQGFVDSEQDKQRLLAALSPPQTTVTLHTPKRELRIALYQAPGSAEAYAMTTPDQPLFRIDPASLKQVAKSLFLLRDKRLFGLMPEELAMLTIHTPTDQYTLIRQTGEWVLEDDPTLPLNQKLIQLFVSRIADLPAELPVRAEPAPPNDFGFAEPSAVFTGKDRRGLDRGNLILGKVQGGLVYAKGAGLPGVFQAQSLILTQIPTRQELIVAPAEND
ncbi:MAG: DUF4340 domain-containing protein [Nitrospirae bacterium]|nr:MAG: DUF4340 domain-containing protein [Nitrospirota bacterium]